MDLQREFGCRVRELRMRQGLTQKQLGQRCGKTFAAQRVGLVERGLMNLTLATIAGLCKGLKCEPLELFLFQPDKADQAPALPSRRLKDLWDAADEKTKRKILRVLSEMFS